MQLNASHETKNCRGRAHARAQPPAIILRSVWSYNSYLIRFICGDDELQVLPEPAGKE